MPAAFTPDEANQLHRELILAGIRLSKEYGMKGMSVEKITSSVGIAKGSFYIFFDSKEDFIIAMAEYAGNEIKEMLLSSLNVQQQMTTHEFIEFLDKYLHSDFDIMNGLTTEDFLWLKKHIKKQIPFDPDAQIKIVRLWLSLISDKRGKIDEGTVVNLIKSIYAIRENSETMVTASLESSITVILNAIEIYISGKGKIS